MVNSRNVKMRCLGWGGEGGSEVNIPRFFLFFSILSSVFSLGSSPFSQKPAKLLFYEVLNIVQAKKFPEVPTF